MANLILMMSEDNRKILASIGGVLNIISQEDDKEAAYKMLMERIHRMEEPVREYAAVVKRLVSKAFTYTYTSAKEQETL